MAAWLMAVVAALAVAACSAPGEKTALEHQISGTASTGALGSGAARSAGPGPNSDASRGRLKPGACRPVPEAARRAASGGRALPVHPADRSGLAGEALLAEGDARRHLADVIARYDACKASIERE